MTEYISCDCKCKFNSATCQCECKNYCKCKEDYSLNPGTCIFENSKYWKIYVILQWSSVMNLSVMDISLTKKKKYYSSKCDNKFSQWKGKRLLYFACSFISNHVAFVNNCYFLSYWKA